MINRRFMIVPAALPNSGHAEQLGKQPETLSCLRLTQEFWRIAGTASRSGCQA
jgi:hypothetical protein